MYEVTIKGKYGDKPIKLKYESREDAFTTIESLMAGDLDLDYKCEIAIIPEEARADVLDGMD